MDGNHQSLLLPHGRDVTMNIGLGKGSGFCKLTIPHRLRTLTKLLPQVMEPGYLCELHLTPHRVWCGEPLAVVQGTFKETAGMSTLLWDSLLQMEQDCIAIYLHEIDVGILFGPATDHWGEFNINLFTFLGDTQ